MKINGYNPYKKGFDMLVADIQEHEARCVTPSRCEPFSIKLSVDGVNRLGDTIAELRMQVAEMVATLKIARECLDNDELALCAGAIDAAMKVGADKTPNVDLTGAAPHGKEQE
jgi:hypothetical protein